MSSQPLVSVLIVAYKGARWIEACLNSIQRSSYAPIEIIVVDGNSEDDGVDLARRVCPAAKVIGMYRNYGFAESNNRASLLAKGKYWLLLNQDGLVDETCIRSLVEAAEKDPATGIWMPKLLYEGDRRVVNATGIEANEDLWAWNRDCFELNEDLIGEESEILAASGCGLMVRADLAKAIGLFDPKFFMYYEDLDLSLRCWFSGHSVRYLPSAVVYHNTRPPVHPARFQEYLCLRNRIRTVLKNFRWKTALPILYRIFRFFGILFLKDLKNKRYIDARSKARAFLWNIRNLYGTLRERKRVRKSFVRPEREVLRLLKKGRGAPKAPRPSHGYGVVFQREARVDHLEHQVNMGENDSGHLGFGWFDEEDYEGRRFRWTTSYSGLYLANPVFLYKDRRLVLDLYSHLWERGPVDVEILVNNRSLGKVTVCEAGWRTYGFELNQEEPILRVELNTPIITESLEGSDQSDRILGVCVASVRIEPGT